MKIIQKVQKEIEEEIEIELPHFRKSEFAFYMIAEEDKFVKVINIEGLRGISVNTSIEDAFQRTIPCAEEEFYQAHNEALTNIDAALRQTLS